MAPEHEIRGGRPGQAGAIRSQFPGGGITAQELKS